MTKKEARKKAKEILKKDRTNFAWRSCWKCNGAHNHLKKADVPINCFGCGRWYYKGIDITED
jgi:ribosomal protein S27E